MIKKISVADILLMGSALLSLLYSEALWFKGDRKAGIFIGLWVPSIIGFGIYFKLLNNKKND